MMITPGKDGQMREQIDFSKTTQIKCEDCAECGCNRADGTCGCDGKMKSVEMNRVFSSVGKPQFKGSGFYETDYKTKEKP